VDGQSRGSEGRGDDGRFDDLPPADIVVPDDARELAAEALTVQRELRVERARAAVARLFHTRRWRRFGLSGPLIIAVLLVVGLVGSTLGVLRPRQATDGPAALPLARAAAPAGQVGGLLPAAEISVDGAPGSSRDLRPAVVVIGAPGCDCERQLDALFAQIQSYELRMYLLGEAELAHRVGNGTAAAVVDNTGSLSATFGGAGITAVLVHADGVIRAVHRDLPPEARLEPELAPLASAGAR
jgi:hypothetical protein